MSYTWSNSVMRYRDEKGKFVSRSTVYGFSTSSIASSENKIETLTNLSQTLSPTDWYNTVKEVIKQEYIRQYLLAYGGVNAMTFSDWGKIGSMVKEQLGYLKNFASELGSLSEAQISQRLYGYINSAREAYETAQAIRAGEWGATEEAWFTNRAAQNCNDCLAYESEGWKPFGYFPQPGTGSTKCLTNCKCWKSYRNAAGEVYYA